MPRSISAAEQLVLELINRARLDPVAEADRYRIDLNKGLNPGTIKEGSRQVVALDDALTDAALGHSLFMLEEDIFSHQGAGNTTLAERLEAAGYDMSNAVSGENIGWLGSTGKISLDAMAELHHMMLYVSEWHRYTMLYGAFKEVGIAQEDGVFKEDGAAYNASMLTTDFAKNSAANHLTGVVYDDFDGNAFYSIGEGIGGTVFSVGEQVGVSAEAGGYGLELSPAKAVEVTITHGETSGTVTVDMSRGNVKLDLVDGTTLLSSGTLTLGDGYDTARLLGLDHLGLNGNAANNTLTGNAGSNSMDGNDGDDQIFGLDGNDRISGGGGNDFLSGGDGNDRIYGESGDDMLTGNFGNDFLMGGTGDDRIFGGNGDDTLNGGSHNDILRGNGGHDVLIGGWGMDELDGGWGRDELSGGGGSDSFRFSNRWFGQDTVTDFEADELVLMTRGIGEAETAEGFLAALHQDGADAVYDLHDDGVNTIRFVGVAVADLTADNFALL